jgi:hypothetical protein
LPGGWPSSLRRKGRVGGEVLERARLALLEHLSGGLALGNLQRVLPAPVDVGGLGKVQPGEFSVSVDHDAVEVARAFSCWPTASSRQPWRHAARRCVPISTDRRRGEVGRWFPAL